MRYGRTIIIFIKINYFIYKHYNQLKILNKWFNFSLKPLALLYTLLKKL